MEWDSESENLIRRIPFFVRKKVRRRVEEYAAARGVTVITPEIVRAVKDRAMPGGPPVDPDDRFTVLRRIENRPPDDTAIPMYHVEACNADRIDCPMSLKEGERLIDGLTHMLEAGGITDFVVRAAEGPLLPHHRFKVSVSSCPNSCSQVQTKDVGIIAQVRPALDGETCSRCGECVEVCREDGIACNGDEEIVLDAGSCIYCGQCITACPSDSLTRETFGYALFVGGRLGRHPRLADRLADLLSVDQLLRAFAKIVELYKETAQPGERFSHVVERLGKDRVAKSIGLPNGD